MFTVERILGHPVLRKKLLIILPDGRIHKLQLRGLTKSFREAPLTVTALAALVPAEFNFEISIADESISQNPFQQNVDLVAISSLTGTCLRAYEIANYFRKVKIPVVLGGVHVTLLPDR